MRAALFACVLLYIASIPTLAQTHYGECVATLQGEPDQIRANSNGQVCVISDGFVKKFSGDGIVLWEKPAENYAQKFLFTEEGTAYILNNGVLTRYRSSDGLPLIYPTGTGVVDFTLDGNGNVYVLTSVENSSTGLDIIILTKFNTAGEGVSPLIIVTFDSPYYAIPKVAVNHLGRIFVSYAAVVNNEYGNQNIFVSSFDADGSNRSDVLLDLTEDFFGETTLTLLAGPSGDFYLMAFYLFSSEDRRFELFQLDAVYGYPSESQVTELNWNMAYTQKPRAVISGNSLYVLAGVDVPPDPSDPFNSPHHKVFKYSLADLTIESVSDLGIYDADILSFYVHNNSFHITRRINAGYGIEIDEYINGNKTQHYIRPNDPQFLRAGAMAYDGNGHYWLLEADCLFKIIPCSEFPLSFSQQPTSVETCATTDVSFAVKGVGQSLSYFWYKDNVLLDDNVLVDNSPKYEGIRTPNLIVKKAGKGDEGIYYCEVRDGCDRIVKSDPARLTITDVAILSGQPDPISKCPGEIAEFDVVVTGGKNVSYQWRKGTTNLIDGGRITGSRSSKLAISSLSLTDAGDYTCLVVADCSPAVVSHSVALSVQLPTTLTVQPALTLTQCNATAAVLNVQATGTNLTFAWRKGGQPLSEGDGIAGTTSNTLLFASLDVKHAGQYSCLVSGACGPPVLSQSTTVTVNEVAEITSHPEGQNICAGLTPTFSISAKGANLVYQWMKGDVPLVNSTKYTGVNTSSLTISTASTGEEGIYTCKVTSACNEIISKAAVLDIGTTAKITGQVGDQSVCEGTTAKLSIDISGDVLFYRWKKNGVVLSNDNQIAGATTGTLYMADILNMHAGTYICEFQSGCGPLQQSDPINLSVSGGAIITKHPLSQTLCSESSLQLSVLAEHVEHYQWMYNGKAIANSATVAGATSGTLLVQNISVDQEGTYSCIVTGCGQEIASDGAIIAINPTPQLSLVLNCDNYAEDPGWHSLVTDSRQTFGQYQIYKNGEQDALPGLDYITEPGIYIIVKETDYCSDEIVWDNQCQYTITSTERGDPLEVMVSPNPSARWINLKYDPSIATHLAVYDVGGRVVLSEQLSSVGEMQIDCDHWAEGMYLVKIVSKSGNSSANRIAIQR